MRKIVGLLVVGLVFALGSADSLRLRAQGGAQSASEVKKVTPNYELASRWTSSKVTNKMIFTSAIAPNWFESGDRFWYAFATAKGQRWMVVDTLKRQKAPLFDPAYMAAQLTSIVRVPFDSAHLPLLDMKLIKKDTALKFELAVPKDTKIPGLVEKAE